MCLSCGNNNVLFCCIVVHEVGVVFRFKGKGKESLISSLKTYHATLHLTSEAFEGQVPCPKTQHLNNVPRLREEKHDISLKNCTKRDSKPHGRQRHRQSATL